MKQESNTPGNWDMGVSASVCQKTGEENRRRGKGTEDAVCIREGERFFFCGLADGQSGKAFGARGGRASLEAVADYLQEQGLEQLMARPFPDELPCLLMQRIRSRLTHLEQSCGCHRSELASTLLAMAMDPATGRYILVHLGDGCALGIPQSGEPEIISPPETGITCRHTWLTTSENAVPHLRIRFGNWEGKRRMLLLSDGMTCLCQGRNIRRRAKAPMAGDPEQALFSYIRDSDAGDDGTCILIQAEKECQRVRLRGL